MSDDNKIYEFVSSDGDDTYTIRKPDPPNYRKHLLLFFLTFITTTLAGVMMSGTAPQGSILKMLMPSYFLKGIPFSLPLMFILLTHEMGHYIASRIHNVSATLPYFIPAPTLIGTFGAFIKMKSPIFSKKALFDIGAAGPIAGFIVSIPAIIIGLKLSTVTPLTDIQGIQIGSSMLVSILAKIFAQTPPEGYDLLIHPIGFAGWIGLFITSLNLIPIGQLDGGHIAYAVFGEKQQQTTKLILFTIFCLGFFWKGWLIWAGIIFFMGRKHPPSQDHGEELDEKRKLIAWGILLIFLMTFIPIPFAI